MEFILKGCGERRKLLKNSILDSEGFNFSETPFATSENDSPQKILKRVGEGKYSLNGRAWTNISEQAKDLVQHLLHADPSKRLSAKQILIHPWVVHLNSLPTIRLNFFNDPSKVMVSR